MMRGSLAVFLILIFSCDNGQSINEKESQSSDIGLEELGEKSEDNEENHADESAILAKEWLIATIEDFFANYNENEGSFSGFCTDEYIEYKRDAILVNQEGYLTEKEFKEKWKRRRVEFAGINDAFLIAAQDFSTVKVIKCEHKKDAVKGSGWFFEVVLKDVDYGGSYLREILVKPAGNSFIIDDIAELENVYPE